MEYLVTIKRFFFLFLAIFIVGCAADDKPPIKLESSEPKHLTSKSKYVSLIQPTLAPTSIIQKKVKQNRFLTSDMIGRNENDLLMLLGKPSFQRFDGPSQLWRYTDKSCLLDLYLYNHQNFQGDKVFKIRFIESRAPAGLPFEAGRCLNVISNKLNVPASK